MGRTSRGYKNYDIFYSDLDGNKKALEITLTRKFIICPTCEGDGVLPTATTMLGVSEMTCWHCDGASILIEDQMKADNQVLRTEIYAIGD